MASFRTELFSYFSAVFNNFTGIPETAFDAYSEGFVNLFYLIASTARDIPFAATLGSLFVDVNGFKKALLVYIWRRRQVIVSAPVVHIAVPIKPADWRHVMTAEEIKWM